MKTISARSHLIVVVGVSLVALAWALNKAPSSEIPKVPSLAPLQALELVTPGRVLVLDVREKKAFDKDHLPGAVSVPIGELDKRIDEFAAHKAEEIVVYCNEGSARGPKATAKLQQAGYTGAKNLEGGIEAWRKSGLATVKK